MSTLDETDSGPEQGQTELRPALRWAGRILVAAWIPALVVVIGALMVGHWVTLPTPEQDGAELSHALG